TRATARASGPIVACEVMSPACPRSSSNASRTARSTIWRGRAGGWRCNVFKIRSRPDSRPFNSGRRGAGKAGLSIALDRYALFVELNLDALWLGFLLVGIDGKADDDHHEGADHEIEHVAAHRKISKSNS